MSEINLITRADDLGSSRAANLAIHAAITSGSFIRNVECMAPAPMMEDAAYLLAGVRGVDLGLHITLTAEWNGIRWYPVDAKTERTPLTLPDGSFPKTIDWFTAHPPQIEDVLREISAQLDALTRLHIAVDHISSHMFPELAIPGLAEAVSAWANEKGLLDHLRYYRMPQEQREPKSAADLASGLEAWEGWLRLLREGQYCSIMHPARFSREMLAYNLDGLPRDAVGRTRDVEDQLLRTGQLEKRCAELGIHAIRYRDAIPQENAMDFSEFLEK